MALSPLFSSTGRIPVVRSVNGTGTVLYNLPVGKRLVGRLNANSSSSAGIQITGGGGALSFSTTNWENLDIVGPVLVTLSQSGTVSFYGYEE